MGPGVKYQTACPKQEGPGSSSSLVQCQAQWLCGVKGSVARGQVMLPGRGPGLRGQILSDWLSSVTQG